MGYLIARVASLYDSYAECYPDVLLINSGSSDYSAPGFVKGQDFKFEKFLVSETIGLPLHSFGLVIGVLRGADGDRVVLARIIHKKFLK